MLIEIYLSLLICESWLRITSVEMQIAYTGHVACDIGFKQFLLRVSAYEYINKQLNFSPKRCFITCYESNTRSKP